VWRACSHRAKRAWSSTLAGKARKPLRAESFQVGSVSLSMKYFGDGRFTEAAFRAAQVAAGAELEEALEPFAAKHWKEAMGSSGTMGAVSQVLAANHITDGRVTPDSLRWLMQQCLRAGSVDKLAVAGIKEDRRAVIAGGLSILYTVAVHFGIENLFPARGALRQGVIFDLDERLNTSADIRSGGQDIRDASVRELQRRFMVDLPQAQRVTQVARALHEQVQPTAARETQRELQWACAVHEIGMMVSHHDHHRHSAYMLANVDAAGFSQSQQRHLGELVLAQRGGLRKVEAALTNEDFAWQVLCLRLATIKCHARGEVSHKALTLKRDWAKANLSFTAEWADSHPRTLYLLQEEAAAWERSGSLKLVLQG
jgi:exopolyphosphatase / guanosine-5'-triphosphate,3'-diphosphate pyrophosphatase